MLDWSFIKQNRFKRLNFMDKNHYPCEFEKVWKKLSLLKTSKLLV